MPVDPPRTFTVGTAIELKDCGRIELEMEEQVTFTTAAGGEYDVVRKSWGFYATPSLNGRLPRFGLRPALVRSAGGMYYVLLVERGHGPVFDDYLQAQQLELVIWLDDSTALEALHAGRTDG